MVTIDDVRALAQTLPRSYEALVRDRVKFRVGQIVYLAFSRDETIMGFAFPKDERDALVAGEPDKFLLPGTSDLRYQWVCVRLAAIDLERCASSCSTPGAWSCRSPWPPPSTTRPRGASRRPRRPSPTSRRSPEPRGR